MAPNRVDKNGIEVEAIILKEGDFFVCHCPSLNLTTQGNTYQEACDAFDEAFNIFLEEVVKMGTLDQVLEEHGWTKVEKKWFPPTVIGQTKRIFQIPA